MNQTANYNLKKPEPTDPLRVADFNENADILDAALKNVRSEAAEEIKQVEAKLDATLEIGYYTGTATDSLPTTRQTVTLGFQPRLLIVRDTAYSGSSTGTEPWTVRKLGIATPGYPQRAYGSYVVLEITETGFICGNISEGFNVKGRTYMYFAVR